MLKGLSTKFLALAFGLTACDDPGAVPDGSPLDAVSDSHFGAVYSGSAVTTEDRRQSYWVQNIAQEFSLPDLDAKPARFEPAGLETCDLPQPSQNATVALVEIDGGNKKAPLYLVDGKDVDNLTAFIRSKGVRPPVDMMLKSSETHQIDVFVTETAKPVYLILTAQEKTLWTLHLAPGAKLDAIAVIGREAQALAHVPIQTLTSIMVEAGSPQSDCMVPPQRPVTASWTALTETDGAAGESPFQENIDQAKAGSRAFRNWLFPKVGGVVATSLVANRSSHILIGPRPEPPIRYRSLNNSVITYSASSLPIWSDEENAAQTVYGWAEAGG